MKLQPLVTVYHSHSSFVQLDSFRIVTNQILGDNRVFVPCHWHPTHISSGLTWNTHGLQCRHLVRWHWPWIHDEFLSVKQMLYEISWQILSKTVHSQCPRLEDDRRWEGCGAEGKCGDTSKLQGRERRFEHKVCPDLLRHQGQGTERYIGGIMLQNYYTSSHWARERISAKSNVSSFWRHRDLQTRDWVT